MSRFDQAAHAARREQMLHDLTAIGITAETPGVQSSANSVVWRQSFHDGDVLIRVSLPYGDGIGPNYNVTIGTNLLYDLREMNTESAYVHADIRTAILGALNLYIENLQQAQDRLMACFSRYEPKPRKDD